MSNRIQSAESVKSLSLADILGTATKASETFTVTIDGVELACSINVVGDGSLDSLADILASGQKVKAKIKSAVGGVTGKHGQSYNGIKGETLAPRIMEHLQPVVTVTPPVQAKPNGQPVPVKS